MESTPDRLLQERKRPPGFPVMRQTWSHLLFAHWKIEPARVQALLPSGLSVDTFSGSAYVGLVPFFMENVRPIGCPSIPWLSHFLELNLRTYVVAPDGTPGVWFFSLDCSQPVAVRVARTFFHLPYYDARMEAQRDVNQMIHYQSQRAGSSLWTRCRYRLLGTPKPAEVGSLEFFLVERYVLFAVGRDQRYLGRVHHQPYPLQPVELEPPSPELWSTIGLPGLASTPDHCLGSTGVDVEIFRLERQ